MDYSPSSLVFLVESYSLEIKFTQVSEEKVMEKSSLFHLARWSAYLSAVATIVGAVTLILFFSIGAPFGVINDATSVVGSLVIIPILFALHQLHRSHAPAASLGALVVGIIVMLVAAT